MVFELKPFQLPGYRQLVTNFRHLLLYRPGLGKTVVCVKAMYDLECRKVLIVCPKNAIKVWENHIKEWFDGLDVANGKVTDDTETSFHIWRWRKRSNNANLRRILWRSTDSTAKVNIWITTYAGFVADYEHFTLAYDCVILDEAKRIRNRRSLAFERLKPLCARSKYFWALTGTPGYKPEHFWTMFHLLDHKQYGSYWRFVEAFYVTISGPFGGRELIAFKNQESWFDLLRRKASILTKQEVGHQETIRAVKYAELTEVQEKYYKEYEENMFAVLDDRIDIAQTSLIQTVKYRQLLCCPAIIDPSFGVGGALQDLVEGFKEEEHSPYCVIFVPFTETFVHFKQYLKQAGYENVQTLSGGLDPDEQERRISTWRQSRVPILVSIDYAQAFSLEPAEECFFIGRSYDPDNNEQAEERLNRLTTKYAVTAHYYLFEGTYDEQQFQILDDKTRTKRKVLPKS
jgi:SNF2 family DNA or RNA helicase